MHLRFPGTGLSVGKDGAVEASEDLLEKGSNNLVKEHSLRRFGSEYIPSRNGIPLKIVALFSEMIRLGRGWRKRDGTGGGEEGGGICESDGMSPDRIRFRDEGLLRFGGKEFPVA